MSDLADVLADRAGRPPQQVRAVLERWPNVQRGAADLAADDPR